jgi:hypothetical protein
MIWLIFALVTLLLLAAVAYPFTQEDRLSVHSFETPRAQERLKLREEKASLLLAMRELDFDFEMGKISKNDYLNLKERTQAKAVEILKKLEKFEAHWKNVGDQIAEKISTPKVKTAFFCGECGSPQEKKNAYCGNCGASLKARVYA